MGDRQAMKKISNPESVFQREAGWCEALDSGDEPALEPLQETAAQSGVKGRMK